MSGYTSDFNDEQRQREYDRQEAHRININLWPEQMQPNLQGQSPGCEFCHRVLVVSKKDPNAYICPDCGNLTPINPVKPVSKSHKFKPKQNAKPSLVIASQQRKPRRKTPLGSLPSSDDGNEELRRELESAGVIAASTQEISEY